MFLMIEVVEEPQKVFIVEVFTVGTDISKELYLVD